MQKWRIQLPPSRARERERDGDEQHVGTSYHQIRTAHIYTVFCVVHHHLCSRTFIALPCALHLAHRAFPFHRLGVVVVVVKPHCTPTHICGGGGPIRLHTADGIPAVCTIFVFLYLHVMRVKGVGGCWHRCLCISSIEMSSFGGAVE